MPGRGDLHASGKYRVALSTAQGIEAMVHGQQRGCTGRIDRVGRAVEIQFVRHAASENIMREPRHRFGAEGRNRTAEFATNELQFVFIPVGLDLTQNADELVDHVALRDHRNQATVDEDAAAENHAGFLAIQRDVGHDRRRPGLPMHSGRPGTDRARRLRRSRAQCRSGWD